MTTTDLQPSRRSGATNERVELGRYTVTAGERIVYGQRGQPTDRRDTQKVESSPLGCGRTGPDGGLV